jgi:hypothetical protein
VVEKNSGRVWLREIFREGEANAEGLTSVVDADNLGLGKRPQAVRNPLFSGGISGWELAVSTIRSFADVPRGLTDDPPVPMNT